MRPFTRLILTVAVTAALATSPLRAGDGKIRHSAQPIKNEYIVVLEDGTPRDDVPAVAAGLGKHYGGDVRRVWRDALKGFFVRMTEQQAQAMSHHPDVKYVEENARIYLSGTAPTNVDPACDPGPGVTCATTDNRLWHLDVIDQNSAVSTKDYSYCETGSGVYVYVVDYGVLRAHREFNNDAAKVLDGYDASGDPAQFPAYDPCHGAGLLTQPADGQVYPAGVRDHSHGTGVASLVNGLHLGVAKDAKVVPVKVFPCVHDGARQLNSATYGVSYATNEIVAANSSYYTVVQGGVTGASGTYPNSGWPWGTPGACCQTWGGVQLAYLGSVPTAGTVQMLVDGLDWIIRPGGNPNPKSPAVVSLSTYKVLGEDGVGSLEDAIANLLKYNNGQGITVIASANNQDANACDTSPGRMSRGNPANPNDAAHPYKVITAGGAMLRNNPDANPAGGGFTPPKTEPAYDATKPTLLARWRCNGGDSDICSADIYASPPPTTPSTSNPSAYSGWNLGSNGGRCVTLFAPAKNIPVANLDATNTYRDSRATGGNASGTSWSAPIVAGMVARILQNNTGYSVDDVYNAVMSRTTADLDPTELNPPNVTCPNDGQPCTTNKVLRLTPVVAQSLPATTVAPSSGNSSITVTASGASPLTYELYQVGSSFNVAAYNTGAEQSTKVAGPQTSNVFSVASTGGVSYFARALSSCGTADTNITTILTAPTGLTATGANGVVTISWTSAAGATGYDVQRKIGSGAWSLAQSVSSSPAYDSPTVPTGVVLYRVVAKAGGASSNPSNVDVAYTKNFTDDPIVAAMTIVKAKHLVEVRQEVNALLDLGGSAPVYAGSDLDEASIKTLVVTPSHFTTAMTNLNTARAAVGLSSVAFQVTPVTGAAIAGTPMANLRSGVK
ncbi:MAG TPA: S8 family serine peptidase [Thermoanaerobaculia bacterium]|nr:S8 family serine peptidase [Thermoanaerobaculia bacterium]